MNDIDELKKHCLTDWALDWGFVHYFDSILNRDIKALISFLPMLKQGIGIPKGHVPCSFYFVFDDYDKLIGRVSIRHYLTDDLRRSGGHIGYAIVPERRGRGYSKEILSFSLNYCKTQLKLNEVLLTCDKDNIPSNKTIVQNNGRLIKNSKLKTKNYYTIKL